MAAGLLPGLGRPGLWPLSRRPRLPRCRVVSTGAAGSLDDAGDHVVAVAAALAQRHTVPYRQPAAGSRVARAGGGHLSSMDARSENLCQCDPFGCDYRSGECPLSSGTRTYMACVAIRHRS